MKKIEDLGKIPAWMLQNNQNGPAMQEKVQKLAIENKVRIDQSAAAAQQSDDGMCQKSVLLLNKYNRLRRCAHHH